MPFNMNVERITSQRGKELLVIDRHPFSKARDLNTGEMKWRCCVRTCAAMAKTIGDSNTVTESNLQHTHPKRSERNIILFLENRFEECQTEHVLLAP
ncbi:hypothetical protein GE061_012644 [Apolygus lucorum]|uniref:FLYWCH-type domain-containing protein n=1 Tax=Apolygus lucorum TaxID=248454 RepID=A0A8S9XT56_APOLU|nr:hypothetical protein GE061_012644 [Apolygus lucorum]